MLVGGARITPMDAKMILETNIMVINIMVPQQQHSYQHERRSDSRCFGLENLKSNLKFGDCLEGFFYKTSRHSSVEF